MGLHILKEMRTKKKTTKVYFYSIREAKLPFISEKVVFKKFEPGEKTESAICNLYPFWEEASLKHWLSFVAFRSCLREIASSHRFTNGHRTTQGGWPASKMADRHQSYFLICPLDEWNYGASDVEVRGATAVETINNTDSSGQNTSLMLMWWACHILIPRPILFHFWETLTAGVSYSDSKIGSALYYNSLLFLFIASIRNLWIKAGRSLMN